MNGQIQKTREQRQRRAFVRSCMVRIVPRSWFGRIIATAAAMVLVLLTFVFFSLLVAVVAVILVLAITFALLKSATGGGKAPGKQTDGGWGRSVGVKNSSTNDAHRSRDS